MNKPSVIAVSGTLILALAFLPGCSNSSKERIRDISAKVPDDYEATTKVGGYLLVGRRAYRLYKSTKQANEVPNQDAVDLDYVFSELKAIREELKAAQTGESIRLSNRIGKVETELLDLKPNLAE